MNEQTTDTREEDKPLILNLSDEDWEAAQRVVDECGITMEGLRYRAAAQFSRESQLRASILACKKAEAANREKDAEITEQKRRADIAIGCLEVKEQLNETLRNQLASLRASEGETTAMRIVLALYRMQHRYDVGAHCIEADRCAMCIQADKLLPAPPTKDKE